MTLKTFFKRAAAAAFALLSLLAAWAIYVAVRGIPRYEARPPELHVAVAPARVERGKQLSSLLCAECHADDKTGKLTGKHMTELPSQFGDIWSKNITQHPKAGIGAWTDGQIAYFLRTGIRPDGQFVPPWMIKLPHISDEDMASVIAYLRSDDPAVVPSDVVPSGNTRPTFLSKALAHTLIKPLPYPTGPVVAPPKADRAAYGRYLVFTLDCYSCHSADFVKVDNLHPEKSEGYLGGGNSVAGADGKRISTANLTPDDEAGIGRWSEADFVKALRKGFRPDGRVLRYPMLPKPELDDDDAAAIYAYLRTVPALHHKVERGYDEPAGEAGPGKKLYVQYGCVGCHGERGVGMGGLADLRHANEHYPDDASLRAWIEDAPSRKPGSKMPAWKGIVREEDYAPLMAYVRELARAPDGREAANGAKH